MKTLIAIRLCTALMFDPTAGLARAIFEAEGLEEVKQRLAALEDVLKGRKP